MTQSINIDNIFKKIFVVVNLPPEKQNEVRHLFAEIVMDRIAEDILGEVPQNEKVSRLLSLYVGGFIDLKQLAKEISLITKYGDFTISNSKSEEILFNCVVSSFIDTIEILMDSAGEGGEKALREVLLADDQFQTLLNLGKSYPVTQTV